MKAKKILTAVASALLSTAVAVSSTVTCFAKSSETNVVSGIDSFENLVDNLDENNAYKASLDLELGKGLTNDLGIDIKPINISGIINNKDGKSSVDGKIKYDSKDLVSINAIYDSTDKKGYVKVPELSNSYISGTADDVKNFLNNIDVEDDDSNIYFGAMIAEGILDDIKTPDFSFEITDLIDKSAEYLGVVVENLPEMTEGNPISGEVDGHKYDYTSKTCKISGYDAKKISQAIYDKAKDDAIIKELSDFYGDSDLSYEQRLKESLLSFYDDLTEKELNETVDLNIYYNDDSFAGFSVSDEKEETRLILIEDNGDFALEFIDKNEYSTDTLKGSLNTNYGIINGVFNYNSQMEDASENTKITVTDLEIVPNSASGKISIESTAVYDGEDATSGLIEIDFNHNEDKTDVKINIVEGKDTLLKAHFVGEKIEPTDVVIPTENVYSIGNEGDLFKFIASCDFDGFLNNAKNVLGDDLYNAIKEAFSFGDVDYETPKDPDESFFEESSSDDDSSKSESKNESSVSDDSSSKKDAESSSVANSSSNSSDKSANTGVKSGVAGAIVIFSGMALVAFRKKK